MCQAVFRCILSALLWQFLLCANLSAQVTSARLEGIVKDATQAVIPGVTVTATNEGTNISSITISNETGLYILVNLPPGSYTITSELPGFKKYVAKGIELKVGDTLSMNIGLETGDVSTEVQVSAAAPMIDVTSSQIGSVVEHRQVLDLPLNGRNPMMLYYLQAGTSPLDAIGGTPSGGSVDGLRLNANNAKVDGVSAIDTTFDRSPAQPNAVVPQEAVAEYRVTTSSATAEAGRGAGAQVSVVYRSGTNEFHGAVYEFNRNTAYNANNFFSNRAGASRPVFLRNQYGVALGGPIKKNKTFFFVNWEGQREIQASIENRLVYTQALRDGIFRFNTARANSTADVDRNGNPVVPYNTIDIFKVDPTRLGLDPSGIVAEKLKQIPLPNNYDIGDGLNLGGYRYTSSNPNHGNLFIAKIDHTLSPKHQLNISLGGRWFRVGSAYLFSGYRRDLTDNTTRNLFIGLVSTLRPNLTNEFHIGALRDAYVSGPPNPANLDTRGNFQLSGLGSGRGTGTNGNPVAVYLPQDTPTVAYNINDNISWVKKNHTFKGGFEVVDSIINYRYGGDEYIPAIYTLNSGNPANVPALSGLASADRSRAQQMVNDLTGTIGNINQTYNANFVDQGFVPYATRHRTMRQWDWGVFFQDTWKAAQNLTVNLGTRWDLLEPAYMANGIFSYTKNGSASVLGISGPAGIYATGLAPDKGKGIYKWDWDSFGPNVGLTWDPFKNGKMSVGANYRITHDRHMMAATSRMDDQNQGALNISLTALPFTRFSDPNLYQTVAGKPAILPLGPIPAIFTPPPFTREGRAYALDENITPPYTQNWSLRIQRALTQNWFVQVSYVGNITVGEWRAINYNQIEIRKNGFLDGFMAAQRNLSAGGNPNNGESIGVLAKLFEPLGGIPASQYTTISQGQAAALADFADTTTLGTGVRGGLVAAANLPVTFFRLNPQVGNASITANLSNSTYNAMKVEVGKRFSAGTYFQFNYTLGKALAEYIGGQGFYVDYRDNLNRKLDKTYQNFDSRHIVQANGVWELPFGANKAWLTGINGWKSFLISGWQMNGIFQLATSRPFTISTGRYTLTLGNDSTADYAGKDFTIAAKVIKGNQILAITPEEKALFTNPAAGSPGGTPLRAFRGPLFTNVDSSMFKNFRARSLGEQGIIQFRAEAFNLFNHANFGLPDSNINSGTFGVISSAFPARILQFALKVTF
jgi:hypothetical protein